MPNPKRELKSNHAIIRRYYETLEELRSQGAVTEGNLRHAFQVLLAETSKANGWTLIPELSMKYKGNRIQPDGTFKNKSGLHTGYWEAKDTNDDLDAEIKKKFEKGYPKSNIIFEDTISAVLIQNGREAIRIRMANADELARLLNGFHNYILPEIEDWEKASQEFKNEVPKLAEHLKGIIKQAHKDQPQFETTFNNLYELCKSSLNPNLARDAVDEMLIQHLLTERVINRIFQQSGFLKHNIIAQEIEKVIEALVSKSFSRDEYLKGLDRFYNAIENAARTIEDFQEKQHFLNTVYERFFQGFSIKVADTHGIVYTPQPIVEFMCNSVAEALKIEFGKELWDPEVVIIDPAVGTGSFIVNLLREGRVPNRELKRFYKEQLFANEVMLLPYYIASLNIEHAYYERTGVYEPFEGLCFVDTLDLVNNKQTDFYITEPNTERIQKQRNAKITVVLGNPPYNAHQINENDNNKNREYETLEGRIRETYVKDSNATNKNALWDAYVKFFKWATVRLEDRNGIVCLISNNSFIDGYAFDGMRKHLQKDFTRLYHFDLRGNVRKGQKEGNVFDIMVSVGITIAIRKRMHKKNKIFWTPISTGLRKDEKLQEISKIHDYSNIKWQAISPDKRLTWILPDSIELFEKGIELGRFDVRQKGWTDARVLFIMFCNGVKTNRDLIVYDFNRELLIKRIHHFINNYNTEIDRWKRAKPSRKGNIDNFVNYKIIDWSRDLKHDLKRELYVEYNDNMIRESLYRPFTKRYLCFDKILNEEVYQLKRILPTPKTENFSICHSAIATEKPFYAMIARHIINLSFVGFGSPCQCFPFYTYKEDGTGRKENITAWALKQFQDNYKDDKITRWDIFYYVYGMLHHPKYRETFADCLKRDLPRIPFAPDFWKFSDSGKNLAKWHLEYEGIEPYELKWIETPGMPLNYRVEKMKLTKDKTTIIVNDSLSLGDVPAEVFEYMLGNRSALEWVIDQYQIKEDKRTGIKSDPNKTEDPEYIVRLVGQVVKVSLETIRIVKELPEEWH